MQQAMQQDCGGGAMATGQSKAKQASKASKASKQAKQAKQAQHLGGGAGRTSEFQKSWKVGSDLTEVE